MNKLAAILFLTVAWATVVPAQEAQAPAALAVFHGCPMQGDARSQAVQTLNRLKNRYTAPTPEQVDPRITLAAILAPGYDVGRWTVREGATITGYVYDVRPGGIETVNCHGRDWADRDTHIELVLDPMQSGAKQRMIVEVTPRWRAIMAERGVDWSTQTLRDGLLGRWVRVTGWMLFDVEHKAQSEHTAPSRPPELAGDGVGDPPAGGCPCRNSHTARPRRRSSRSGLECRVVPSSPTARSIGHYVLNCG